VGKVCGVLPKVSNALSYLTHWPQRSRAQARLPGDARPHRAGGLRPAEQVLRPIYRACRRDVSRDLRHPHPALPASEPAPWATASRRLGARLRNVSAAGVPERSQARRTPIRYWRGFYGLPSYQRADRPLMCILPAGDGSFISRSRRHPARVSGDHLAACNGTAPIEVSAKTAQDLWAVPAAATAGSTRPPKRRVVSGCSVQCDAGHGYAERSQDLVPQPPPIRSSTVAVPVVQGDGQVTVRLSECEAGAGQRRVRVGRW
jgi:hypothetical protein